MRPAARVSRWLSLMGAACVGLGVSGCVTTTTRSNQVAASWHGSRSVTLVQTDTGERLSVVYGRDGRYDPAAMRKITELFRDRHNGETSEIDPHLMDVLYRVREELGLPVDTPFVVTSGYRSPITNAALARQSPNVAERSYHLRGQAVDFHIDGVSSERIAETAGALGLGGYAWYPHTGHVHLDTGPVRTWTPAAPRRGGGWVEVRRSSRQQSATAVAAVPSKPTTDKKAGKVTVAKATPASKPTKSVSTKSAKSTSKSVKVAAAPSHKPSKTAAKATAKTITVASNTPRPTRSPIR